MDAHRKHSKTSRKRTWGQEYVQGYNIIGILAAIHITQSKLLCSSSVIQIQAESSLPVYRPWMRQ